MTREERNALRTAIDGLHANLMWYVNQDEAVSSILDHLLLDVEVFKRHIGGMLDQDAAQRETKGPA